MAKRPKRLGRSLTDRDAWNAQIETAIQSFPPLDSQYLGIKLRTL